MKNNRNKNKVTNRSGHTIKRVDVDRIEHELRKVLANRNSAQRDYDNAWSIIKNKGQGRNQLKSAREKIGASTNRLNQLVGQLSKYNKTHRAMNLADNYLTQEIKRNKRIIKSTERTIYEVKNGISVLIDSYGNQTTDYASLEKYIRSKRNQITRLQSWQRTIKKYVA